MFCCNLFVFPSFLFSRPVSSSSFVSKSRLVKGASTGEGLGNAFLSHIKACDGIFQLVRLFENEDVTHVEGTVDPIRDLEIIATELRAKDIQFMENEVSRMEKHVRQVDKSKKPDLDCMQKVLQHLQDGKDVRDATWTASEIMVINTLFLLTAKPTVYLANMCPEDYIKKKNKWLKKLLDYTKARGNAPLIPFSAALEAELEAMNPDQLKAWEEEHKAQSALPKIIKIGFKTLNLIYFFTAGSDEVKAWTVTRGYKAPQAAGTIHTDFEKGFICADIYNYEDFVACESSEQKVKDSGKMRQQGSFF